MFLLMMAPGIPISVLSMGSGVLAVVACPISQANHKCDCCMITTGLFTAPRAVRLLQIWAGRGQLR